MSNLPFVWFVCIYIINSMLIHKSTFVTTTYIFLFCNCPIHLPSLQANLKITSFHVYHICLPTCNWMSKSERYIPLIFVYPSYIKYTLLLLNASRLPHLQSNHSSINAKCMSADGCLVRSDKLHRWFNLITTIVTGEEVPSCYDLPFVWFAYIYIYIYI